MSKEANIATQKKMGDIINSYRFEKLHEVFAPGVKDHDPADDQGPGPEGFAQWFTQFHSAFPDFQITVEHLVADEDNVAFAYTITGTQGGPFNGIPSTGNKIKVRGMRISKFNSDSKIVERWWVFRTKPNAIPDDAERDSGRPRKVFAITTERRSPSARNRVRSYPGMAFGLVGIPSWGASHEVGILQQIGAMKPVQHLDEPPIISAPTSAGQI